MADFLGAFRQKAEDLVGAINRRGGIRATIEGLRRQMAEADRRRAVGRVRGELKRLDRQITEMITAVGVQTVGLHKAGRLASPALQPLCQHMVELEAALAQQEAELAKLESQLRQGVGPDRRLCTACGKPLIAGGTFCPHCGAAVSPGEAERFCAHCGTELRPLARFCARCGQPVGDTGRTE
jgi:hypothetical protein